MPFDPNKERIDKLQEDLYSRQAPEITRKERPTLSPREVEAPRGNWQTDQELARELSTGAPDAPRSSSFFAKLFFGSMAFFVVAAAIAGYIFWSGSNIVSSRNVEISVGGLTTVSAGQELSLDITVRNNNNVPLTEAQMIVEYPDGTRSPIDINVTLTRDTIPLEMVPAGGSITKTVKGVFFGEKDSVKEIKVSVDYKQTGSSARFTKEKTYDISISSAPIVVSVDMPKEINAGQEFAMTVGITSNSTVLVRGMLLHVDYPFGFTPADANPDASYGDNTWLLGDLSPTEKKTIIIKGRVEGQDEEERTFRFSAGLKKPDDEQQLGVIFSSSEHSVVIKKPFIAIGLALDYSDGKESIVPVDTSVQGKISWTNNLAVDLSDVMVQIKFTGQALDRNQVVAQGGGFYRSADNTISWTKNSAPALALVEPGESGSFNFNIHTIPLSNALALPGQGKNMEVLAEVTVSGTRLSPGESAQSVVSKASQKIKVATNLSLNSRPLYSIGPFTNSGPIPPRADERTTYTVTWTLSNTFNDVGGANVSATLPPYISWLSTISPAAEKVSYDSDNRSVVWNVGEVKAGAGGSISPRQVSFQIALEPSLSQVGQSPNLLEGLQVTGIDRFTGKNLFFSLSPLTTRISTDPSYEFGDEHVVR